MSLRIIALLINAAAQRRALTPRLVAATTAAKGGFYSEGTEAFVTLILQVKIY